MGIPIFDARALQQLNRRKADKLRRQHQAITTANQKADRLYEAARQQAYDELLAPFSAAFGRLQNVELVDLAPIGALPSAGRPPGVDLQAVRVSALGALGTTACGAIAGAGTAAGTFAAVGAFASASTGVAISSLSGVAATNATLAFLGGGTLAAGGGGVAAGTAVLAGVAAAPLVIFLGVGLHLTGRKALQRQRRVLLDLRRHESQLLTAEALCAAARDRSAQAAEILGRLVGAGRPRVGAFAELVCRQPDFGYFTWSQKEELAVTGNLVTATLAVMSAPLCDELGVVTDLSADAIADAELWAGTVGEAA